MKQTVILNQEVFDTIHKTGASINTVLDYMYADELAEARNSNPAAKNLSAAKIALTQAGIRKNTPFDAVFTSNDNKFLFPAFMMDMIDQTMTTSSIMSDLVTNEIGITAKVVEAPTVNLLSDENKNSTRRSRVAEGAEFSFKTLNIEEVTAKLFKKGLAVKQTYEALRLSSVDMVQMILSAAQNDIVGQNVADATSVLETDATTISTTAVAGDITADELYDAMLEYQLMYGMAPTTILANKALWKKLAKLQYTTNEAFGVNSKINIELPQFNGQPVRLLYAPVSQVGGKDRVLMYNKDKSLTRFVQNGSVLTEYDKSILSQHEFAVMSEVSGYANFMQSVGSIVSK